MKTRKKRPLLIVLSGPSGVGKTTIGGRLLAMFPDMRRSVSFTTRAPRRGEVNGRDYEFVSARKFRELAAKNSFIECAEVHGQWYGTPKKPALSALAAGKPYLLVIDVQGAARVREWVLAGGEPGVSPEMLVDIFVLPPTFEALRERISKRGVDDTDSVKHRLTNAKTEMKRAREYAYRAVNDDLDAAVEFVASIIGTEQCRDAITRGNARAEKAGK